MLDWDTYFMCFAKLASQRAHCLRRNVGAVLVRDRAVIATGYNGPPSGVPHCIKCLREELRVPSGERHELCHGVHAEQNVLVQSARLGVSVCGSTLYTLVFPCSICFKLIINAAIVEVVYEQDYTDPLTDAFIEVSKVRVRKL